MDAQILLAVMLVYVPLCCLGVAWWTARTIRYQQQPLTQAANMMADVAGTASELNARMGAIVDNQQATIAGLNAVLSKKGGVVPKVAPASGNGHAPAYSHSRTESLVNAQDIEA